MAEHVAKPPEHSPPASHDALVELFVTTRVWSEANLALFFDDADSNRPPEHHNGLPYVYTPPGYALAIPGDIICELEPEAAATIGARHDFNIVVQFEPPAYIKEDSQEQTQVKSDDEIEYHSPWVIISNQSATTSKTLATCMINIDPEDYNAVVEGTGPEGDGPEVKLSEAQCQAYQKIISRLDDYRALMVQRDLYPAYPTPEALLHYRREYEIGRRALELVASAERDQAHQQMLFERQAEQAQRLAENHTRADNEARLAKVPVIGEVNNQVSAAIEAAMAVRGYGGRQYSGVSRSEVEVLRQEITERLLCHNLALHVFEQPDVQHIARAFDTLRARQTTIEAISLKAESSQVGPIVTFTITKDILTGDGLKKSVIEAYAFGANSYIKFATTVDMLTGNSTRPVHNEEPLSRLQCDVFKWLLGAITNKGG